MNIVERYNVPRIMIIIIIITVLFVYRQSYHNVRRGGIKSQLCFAVSPTLCVYTRLYDSCNRTGPAVTHACPCHSLYKYTITICVCLIVCVCVFLAVSLLLLGLHLCAPLHALYAPYNYLQKRNHTIYTYIVGQCSLYGRTLTQVCCTGLTYRAITTHRLQPRTVATDQRYRSHTSVCLSVFTYKIT